MAGDGSQTTTTTAPPADEMADLADLDLPEGMNPDDLLAAAGSVAAPEAVAPPPETPEPPAADVAPEPPAPAAAPPKRGNVGKALAQEREKVRRLRGENEYYAGLLANIEEERRAGRATPGGLPAVQPFQLAQPDPAAALAAAAKTSIDLKPVLGADADHLKDGMGEVAKAILIAAHKNTEVASRQTFDAVIRYRQQEKEAEVREELAEQGLDYDDLLQRAGVFEALRFDNGQFRDPAMARAVYGSANWARRAVKLAQTILRGQQNGSGSERSEEIPEPTTATPARARPAAPAASPSADAIAEARRAGARETAEALATSTQRHRGIRVVRNAGAPPQVGLTAEFWDRIDALVDSPHAADRGRAQQIFDRNAHISEWYERGRPRG